MGAVPCNAGWIDSQFNQVGLPEFAFDGNIQAVNRNLENPTASRIDVDSSLHPEVLRKKNGIPNTGVDNRATGGSLGPTGSVRQYESGTDDSLSIAPLR